MKFARTSATVGLLALAAMVSPCVSAADSGWYAGGSIGRSGATIDDARITSGLAAGGLATTSITDRDRDTGYKLFGGYQLNRHFAVEGGYFNLGEFGYRATTVPAGTLDGNIKLRGLNLDLIGILPIGNRFSLFGRLGLNHAQARDTFVGTGAVVVTNPSPSKRDTNYKFGAGIKFAITEALAVRLEGERYRVDDAVGNKGHIDMLSVGLVYQFGGPVPVVRAAAPAPVMVAVTPPPPVAVMPAPAPVPPPPPRPTRVTFAADSLFDFDQAVVKPQGKQSLDKFVADLRGAQYDAVRVTGHTDRLGPHNYNLRLSSRRAEAVSAYLVSTGGIPASKISATGVDGANPVTKPGDCKGNRPTPQLIACLQPDRRVEVEVSGTR